MQKTPCVTAFTKINECMKKGLEGLPPDSVCKQKDESGSKQIGINDEASFSTRSRLDSIAAIEIQS